MALIILVVGWFSFSSISQESVALLKSAAESHAEHVATYLNQNIERFKLISSRTQLRKLIASYRDQPAEAVRAEIIKIISDAKESIREFERVCIIDLNGRIIAPTDSRFIGREVADKNFLLVA